MQAPYNGPTGPGPSILYIGTYAVPVSSYPNQQLKIININTGNTGVNLEFAASNPSTFF